MKFSSKFRKSSNVIAAETSNTSSSCFGICSMVPIDKSDY